MGRGIRVEGIDALAGVLKKNATLDDVRRAVRKNGRELQGVMVKNSGESTFCRGFFTGALKQDVSAQGFKLKDGGLTACVGSTKAYGPYLEFGTRFMAAEPFVKPSLDVQAPIFESDMRKLVKG
ncbi:MAG: HK97 gp10 family phage protein [Oscillospiraceae bacterium]|nr:HK97 gp10 family phage protein [Oscillospiraceae bacterium]MDD4511384.1 HK97 gp10 family phage protein [Oscillospiraceae bacterium]